MAGKTLISGTAYDLTAGKTLIGGTAYNISKGKTLTGGTAYDILFNANAMTIAELFANATILATDGTNSKTSNYAFIDGQDVPSGTVYLFITCGTHMSIWKIVDKVPITTPIFITPDSPQYRGHALQYYGGDFWAHRGSKPYDAPTSGGGTKDSLNKENGHTIALLSFSYPDAVVDALLGGISYAVLAGRNTTSLSTTRATITACIESEIQVTTKAATLTVYQTVGNTVVKILGTGSDAATISGSYLTLGSVYGGSIIGLSST